MKKLYKIFLIGTMSLMLAACGNDEANATKAVEEGNGVEETVEKSVTEESVAEEPVTEPATEESTVVEEKNTTEYQLTQMDTGFYGGIAWATVSGDTGTKHVLINKELQVVYELPEGMETGDIFDGKAIVIHSDQSANPGFMILGADGSMLYECSDNLTGESYPGYNVNFTRDGSTIYERKESGLTANTAYACILNDKFETVAQIEIPEDCGRMDAQRFYYCLSDGVYGGSQLSHDNINMGQLILNANEHNTININNSIGNQLIFIVHDMDRCAGLELYDYGGKRLTVVNAENFNYSEIADRATLENLATENGKMYNADFYLMEASLDFDYYGIQEEETAITFNHGFMDYTVQNDGVKGIEGIALPDFGAEVTNFRLSNDGEYVALQLRGADGNMYYTVIGNDGQKLYDPVTVAQIDGQGYNNMNFLCWCGDWGVCDGYILYEGGAGITTDGKIFQWGDGTALPGIGEDSFLHFLSLHGSSNTHEITLSGGYVVCNSKLYSTDGTEVTTVTAVK